METETPMNGELTIRVRVPVPCTDCDGKGVHVGQFNPETGRRETFSCPKCDGFGLRFVFMRHEEAFLRKESP